MAIAFVQEFDVGGDTSTANYDALNDRLEAKPGAKKPPGLIIHTAGFTPDGVFRVFGVWETEADLQTYLGETLMPEIAALVESAGDPASAPPPDRQYTYGLHDVWRSA